MSCTVRSPERVELLGSALFLYRYRSMKAASKSQILHTDIQINIKNGPRTILWICSFFVVVPERRVLILDVFKPGNE